MPAQALITHLSKPDAQKLISEASAADLLSIKDSPPHFLIVCAEENGHPKAGAHDALQKICDADSKIVRAEAKKLADAEEVEAAKAKDAEAAKAKAAKAKPTQP